MKICFLAPANNYHTKKWCDWFVKKGHDVSLISFTEGSIEGVQVIQIKSGVKTNSSDQKKLLYLTHARKVRKIVDQLCPDIVNVHYASSYGAVAALSGIKGYVLSVWGKDVYTFPRKSFFHKILIRYSLGKASYLFSTSKAMAEETKKYTKKKIYITPFGVDMNLFTPDKRTRTSDTFIIGNIKALDKKYGIDRLLKAARIILNENPDFDFQIRIAGKGPDEESLKKLCHILELDFCVSWLGFIPQDQVAREWANMDLAVITSQDESESFGVSAVEAQASGIPVIVTDIPGLMEATKPGVTSIVVKRNDEEQLAREILCLYHNSRKRENMGREGREYVQRRYGLERCFNRIESLYHKIIAGRLRK